MVFIAPMPAATAAATLPTAATTTFALPAATTMFAARVAELRRDVTSDYDGYGCIDAIDSASCDLDYLSCLGSVEADYVSTYDYLKLASAITSCYCDYGVQYLNCYYSAIEGSACSSYYGTYDWASYESGWFYSSCGTVPASLHGGKASKTKLGTPPTSVSLDLQSVDIVTLNSTLSAPTYAYTPLFQSTGDLLQDECASTHFTLIEDASTVFWAALVGCASDKPQCCPFTASSAFFAATLTADTTVTVTTTGTAGAVSKAPLNAFPVAATNGQAVVKKCAADYYAISGACCPSNFWPFTTDLGGQTPCYSSLLAATEAPTLTAGLVGQPTDTAKPTSAVVNIVWAMSYPVEAKSGLSTGGIAGVAVGSVFAVAAIGVLSFCLFRYRRKTKTLEKHAPPSVPPPHQEVGPHQNGAAPPGQFAAGDFVHYPAKQPSPVGYPATQPSPVGFLAPSVTPASMLAPQSTGTTTVSELNGGLGTGGSSPHPAGTVSPAGVGYPAPIAEGDEHALQQQQQAAYFRQQQQQQNYQQPPQQGYGAAARGQELFHQLPAEQQYYQLPADEHPPQQQYYQLSADQHPQQARPPA